MRLIAALALSAAAMAAQGEERVLDLEGGRSLRYEVLDEKSALPSARESAAKVVGFLASGDVEAAARLSNAPQRRLEVLQQYRASVGEDEFKRVFAQFLSPRNRVATEVAMGRHRLLIWNLGDANDHLAAQYYVEVEGRFLIDDVPSDARADLQRILQSYRKARP